MKPMIRRWAPWAVLGVSLLAHVLVTLAGADPFKMIDLRVYLDGAQWALDGTLYDSTSNSVSVGGQPIVLPFTYPPFAALVFVPLAALNFVVVRVLWQLASLAALALIIYLTLRLLGRAGRDARQPLANLRGTVVAGTALALWLEPVRTTFNYGQINLFLALLLLAGAATTKNWLAGATVGIAAGIKLVPAITGLYYLASRRWRAAAACVAAFAVTVALAAVVLPRETQRYFLELIFDPARTGPVFGAINQSWRGALARLAGVDDVPKVWLVAVAVTAVLALWALRICVVAGDRTAAFLSVQFLGLLVSPISWSHHWVWIVPLLIWCFFGPHRSQPGVRVLAALWLLAAYSYLVSVLVAQPNNYEISSRPGWAAAAGMVYVVLGMATLVVLGGTVRRHPTEVLDSVATRESGAPG
jgi:alpha-1,2-mannosyltransferase